MNTKIIKFDINKNLYDTLIAKQGDTKSRFLLFNLLDGSIPFSLENRSVRVYAIKPDKTEIFNDLIITNPAKGYCILELTTQMLAVSGTIKLELMVIEGDKKLTSNIFYMDVKESINSEKAIVSTNEFGTLLTALASLNEYDNYKNEIAEARDGEKNLLTKVKKLDEQLETKGDKYYLTPLLFGAKADGKTDDTKAIQSTIDLAKKLGINIVRIPAGKYVVTTLLIPEFFTFEGVGRGTIFIQTNKATGDIIKFKQGACFSTVRGLKLQGTYDTTKPVRHGICMTDYVNETGYFDSGNIVENIYISDVTGDGIYVGWNQRGCRIENVDITRCNKSGIRVHGSDNSITNCNASVCREPDIMNDWGGWNNRYIGCKGFHAGVDNTATNLSPETYMMRILGNCNHVFSDMQESVGGALHLQGAGNKIELMIDACGKKSYETGIETTVIKIDENSIGNNIKANIIDGTLDGYSKYMLDISNKAFNNVIDLTFFQSGDLNKRQDIQLNKTPYHFSNVVKLNGVTYIPVLYEKIKFTSVNGNDGINILWNVQQEGDTYTIDINKSLNTLNNNGWMYLCFNNKLNNDMVQEAKKHNGGTLQLQFDLETNAILSEKYVVDVITFAGETTATDVFQRWTKQGTIYMNIPCKIVEEATEYSIGIGIRKIETENTITQPLTTTLKVSNLKISFGDYIEDRQVLSTLAKVYAEE